MEKLKILVIEDDKLSREILADNLTGQIVDFAEDKASAERKLKTGQYDICFIDLMLGENDKEYSGLKLIPLAASKGIYSVVMSSCETEDTISKAYALGCKEFYVKGNEKSNISAIIARYLQGDAGKKAQSVFSSGFITHDPATRSAITEALKYAPTHLPLLILGPSGTGKTTLAKLLHEHSGRKGEFTAINCAAYAEELLEAELFGYKKGAFTDAKETRKGKLAQADNGTLFLDEIGSMSHNMQTKLLKAIEEKSFYPLGADRPEYSDFRVISATLEDMQKLLAEQKLRFDFFQRIHGMTITIPPLAHRKCDIFPLIQAFTKGGKRLAFEPEAKEYLLAHGWPGNTRELKRFVDIMTTGTDGQVTLGAVKRHVTHSAPPQLPGTIAITQQQYDHALKHGLPDTLDQVTAEIINRNLNENNGKRINVREQLKISKRLLYSVLDKEQHKEKV